jgi:hypothetical protein
MDRLAFTFARFLLQLVLDDDYVGAFTGSDQPLLSATGPLLCMFLA